MTAGLYIHVPFCGSKCAYCDFYSMPPRSAAVMEEYVDAVIAERRLRAGEPGAIGPSTLYIGGGTPSKLPVRLLEKLLAGIGVEPSACEEATIEANPEDITPEWTEAVIALGFGRVSIGVQSLADNELAFIGRRHNSAGALKALDQLLGAGLRVSADLIYGLPLQTPDTWLRSLDGLIATGVTHISAYSLGIEEGTRLNAMRIAGKFTPVADDVVADMYAALCGRMAAAGFEHYEISNFARPGQRAVHNTRYWDFTPYLGLGSGAHSFDGSVRRYNPASLRIYTAALASGTTAFETEEAGDTDRANDYIITALRRREGLDTARFVALFGERALRTLLANARHTEVTVDHGRLYFTEDAWLRSDASLRNLLID